MSSDLLSWIALRRVHGGHVANVAGCWIDGSYRVPCYLPETLNDLTELADDGSHGPLQRASLTETGQARYVALRDRHGAHIARVEREPLTSDIQLCDLSSAEPRARPCDGHRTATTDGRTRWKPSTSC